ncbi:MAG: RNA methyltransferase [Bacteroidales bacterium]|nr:RNA methyltransferase [Bacteroidales bacterium]
MLSKNKIKFINALKEKKVRTETGLFIIEGDKMVTEVLINKKITVNSLIAIPQWLKKNRYLLHDGIREIAEVTEAEFNKVTSFETPAGVLVILPMPVVTYNENDLAGQLSICLDSIQDPGNLGTIIRIAGWFGIRNIFCSPGCADCFNPKVVQASMGAVLRVGVHYIHLDALLENLCSHDHYSIYGSFLKGESLYERKLSSSGMLVFGNESRGIHPSLKNFIHVPLTIPSFSDVTGHVDSLNVAAAVAIFCSEFFRNKARKAQ